MPARGGRQALVLRRPTTDLLYLEQVVQLSFPFREARAYLHRHMANPIRLRFTEAMRGERVGVVREVEIIHRNSSQRSFVRSERLLQTGEAASYYVPDHLVQVKARALGSIGQTRMLFSDDELVLHVPVRSYLRFLPSLFQGEGPVQARQLTTIPNRQVRALPDEHHIEELAVDEEPVRRMLLMFQHVMTSVTDEIDAIPNLTDPMAIEAKFLPWLASWVGFDLDASLPVHQQRELVRRAIRLMRMRGTRAGIEEMVRVLTSAPARIEERRSPQPFVLGKATLAGGPDPVERYERSEPPAFYAYEPHGYKPTSFFTLRLERLERFRERFGERAGQVIRRIINVVSAERPTHVHFVIRFDDARG